VWFANQDDTETIRHVQLIGPQGLPSTYLEVMPTNGLAALAFGGGRVFVGDELPPGTLRSYAEDGGDMQTLDDQNRGITAVAADDFAVYFAETVVTPGVSSQIFARRHDNGVIMHLADESEPVDHLAIDGPWLYWLTRNVAPDSGSLKRTPK
jgi:hypothetical protein